MDDARFDGFVRRLHSRRGVVRALLGGGAALGVATMAKAAAGQCLATGSECDPASPDLCCSGRCKKHKHQFRCAPAGAAWGCLKQLDSCSARALEACPEHPSGLCVNDNKGKPLCIVAGEGLGVCFACTRDDDCMTDFGPTARCLKHCQACKRKAGIGSICVVPVPVV